MAIVRSGVYEREVRCRSTFFPLRVRRGMMIRCEAMMDGVLSVESTVLGPGTEIRSTLEYSSTTY
jgi:hypothetical protein